MDTPCECVCVCVSLGNCSKLGDTESLGSPGWGDPGTGVIVGLGCCCPYLGPYLGLNCADLLPVCMDIWSVPWVPKPITAQAEWWN